MFGVFDLVKSELEMRKNHRAGRLKLLEEHFGAFYKKNRPPGPGDSQENRKMQWWGRK